MITEGYKANFETLKTSELNELERENHHLKQQNALWMKAAGYQ